MLAVIKIELVPLSVLLKCAEEDPITCNGLSGDVVPMPTFPLNVDVKIVFKLVPSYALSCKFETPPDPPAATQSNAICVLGPLLLWSAEENSILPQGSVVDQSEAFEVVAIRRAVGVGDAVPVAEEM